jgi:signal transduction histidine kinase
MMAAQPLRSDAGVQQAMTATRVSVTDDHGQPAGSATALADPTARLLHDARNALTALANNAKHLSRLLPGADQAGQRARRVLEAATHLAALLDELQSLHSPTSPAPTAQSSIVDVNGLLRCVLAIAPPDLATRAAITWELDQDLTPVRGTPSRLQRVFANIVRNAADAMPDGGELTIRSWRHDNWVHVEIEDTGRGMARQQLDAVVAGSTTSGLIAHARGHGLQICKQIVREHGGELHVETCPGVGTKVRVSLPCPGSAETAAGPIHLSAARLGTPAGSSALPA